MDPLYRLKGIRLIRINCLASKVPACSIEPVAKEEIIRKYADGGCLKQLVFDLVFRLPYDLENEETDRNAVFLEKLAGWMKETSGNGILPELPDGMTAISIEAVTPGVLKNSAERSARYELRARVVYEVGS